MKTYNGKSVSIKQIHKVLRTMNRTQIYRLYYMIYGYVDRIGVYRFMDKFAPNKKVSCAAYDLIFHFDKYKYIRDQNRKSWEFIESNKYHIAMDAFRKYIKFPNSPYTKRPIMGCTHLYFASPVYRLRDYNKWEVMPIAGNERFCETICKLADKYFPTHEIQNNCSI